MYIDWHARYMISMVRLSPGESLQGASVPARVGMSLDRSWTVVNSATGS